MRLIVDTNVVTAIITSGQLIGFPGVRRAIRLVTDCAAAASSNGMTSNPAYTKLSRVMTGLLSLPALLAMP